MDWIRIPFEKEWLTVGDVADYMDVSTSVVTGLLRAEELPGVKMGREWRILARDLEDWINAQRGARP